MTTREILHVSPAGGTWTAFPLGKSLSQWDTYKVPLTPDASPNDSRYRGSYDDAWGTTMLIYNTSTVPTSWDSYLFDWEAPDLSVEQGNFTVTVTALAGVTPVSGVRVTILSGGVSIRSGVTNSSGVAQFLLDAGTYTVNASTFGYASVIGTSLVVTDTRLISLPMVAESTGSIVAPGQCLVRCVVYENDGATPKVGAIVSAKLDKNTAINAIFLSNLKTSGVTDVNGVCDLILVQGDSISKGDKKYLFEVSDASDPDSCEVITQFRAVIPTLSFVYSANLLLA